MVYDESCDLNIKPDADVGGYGVMTSFVVLAWMTTALSAWDAWVTWRDDRRYQITSTSNHVSHANNPASLPAIPVPGPQAPRPACVTSKVKEMLIRLIDLQIATGVGITIAGVTQIILYEPSYYHYELINNYWWLTMQSLWVVPDDFLNIASLTTNTRPKAVADYEQTNLSPYIRIMAVLISTLLGTFFQAYILVVENNDTTGPCYNFLYGPIWDWTGAIWVTMTGLYAIVLILILARPTRVWILDTVEFTLETWEDKVYTWAGASYRALAQGFSSNGNNSTSSGNGSFLTRLLTLILSGICAGAFWLFIQFLAVCAYGEGFYPFVFLVCTGFNTWTTVDIISTRIVNEPLLGEDERKMGFGQVLPLVLIFSVFLPSMGVAGKETRTKTWTIRRTQTLVGARSGSGIQT